MVAANNPLAGSIASRVALAAMYLLPSRGFRRITLTLESQGLLSGIFQVIEG